MKTFGPVPSRRLGRSLGINNIPHKTCSYSCIYCQEGKTTSLSAERKEFFSPKDIFENVKKAVKQCNDNGEHIDYLSFVPSGEPTLDINLGNEIDMLKTLGIKIAVITNASLIFDYNVSQELAKADLISVKIDAVSPNIWKSINRPDKSVNLDRILDGISLLKETFNGKFITETMLVSGINDEYDHVYDLASFLGQIEPDIAYLSIPTRPPALKGVSPPNKERVTTCYYIMNREIECVEYLTRYEGDDFGYTGDIKHDILNTASIHPLTESALVQMLNKAVVGWDIVEELIFQKRLSELEYENQKYFVTRQ